MNQPINFDALDVLAKAAELTQRRQEELSKFKAMKKNDPLRERLRKKILEFLKITTQTLQKNGLVVSSMLLFQELKKTYLRWQIVFKII